MTELLAGRPGKKILMFFPKVPYPLHAHGISIRYLPIIEHLSRSHTLDLVIFRPRPEKKEHHDELRKYCRDVTYLQNPKYLSYGFLSKLSTYCRFPFPWSPPLSLIAHEGADTVRSIADASKKDTYDALVWVGSSLLPYLLAAMPLDTVGKVLVDFIDSPSLIKERWKNDTFRSDLLDRYELWKTIRWEGDVIRRMDDTIYISDVDAGTVPKRYAPGKQRHVLPNGVDFDSYVPGKLEGVESPSIGFLGTMSYLPNVEAAKWLFGEVFLPLKKKIPGLSLFLIGRAPVNSILELGKCPGVTVTGTVDNIWTYVNSVDLFLFPLWKGAGLKNKVLESMYARRPVLTTPIGNEGINAVSGRDLLVCGDSGEFREKTLLLLDSADECRRIGDNAREFVRQRFAWPPILRAYEEILSGGPGRL